MKKLIFKWLLRDYLKKNPVPRFIGQVVERYKYKNEWRIIDRQAEYAEYSERKTKWINNLLNSIK